MNNTLKPDWWKHPLPDYLGQHKSNYVLNEAETEAFGTAIYRLHTILGSEGQHLTSVMRALRTGRVPVMMQPPVPATLNDMMGVVMEMGKTSKLLLEIMTAAAKKRGEANEAEARG